MQNTGQGSEKRSYRVILLLIVGLAAFSSAMKELNQVHQLTLETGQLVARWTDMLPKDQNEMLVKVETCDSKILPPVPPMPAMPALPAVPPIPAVPAVPSADVEIAVPDAPPAVRNVPESVPEVPRVKPRRVGRTQRDDAAVHASSVRVFVSADEVVDKALKAAFVFDFNQKALKAKNRRQILTLRAS